MNEFMYGLVFIIAVLCTVVAVTDERRKARRVFTVCAIYSWAVLIYQLLMG